MSQMVVIALRVPREEKAAIQREAKGESRTISNYLRLIIKKGRRK
ncbi:MAG: hypothetical protein ACE5J5_07325 [Candidatus Hydrothermarchaeales archaeon]